MTNLVVAELPTPVAHLKLPHSRMRALLAAQPTQYLLVGALCTMIDISLFNVLTFVVSVDAAVAKLAAGAVAIVVSFTLNKTWTFRRAAAGCMRTQFTFYLAINVVSAFISVGCLRMAEQLDLTGVLWTNVAAFSVVLIFGTVGRFLLYRRWVFRPST